MQAKMMKESEEEEARPKRHSVSYCHEAGHYILQEHVRRTKTGHPHPSKNDIVNDWIVAMGKSLGLEPYEGETRGGAR